MLQLQCARCSVPSPQLNTVTAVFNLPPSTENANCGVTIHGHFNKNPLAHSPSHRADAAVKLQLRCRASKNKNNRISPIIMCHHCLRSHSRCRSSGRRRGTWAHAVIGRRRAAVARGAHASQPPSPSKLQYRHTKQTAMRANQQRGERISWMHLCAAAIELQITAGMRNTIGGSKMPA